MKQKRAFTPGQRQKALEFATKHGVKDASAKYGIHESMIYKWRRSAAKNTPTIAADNLPKIAGKTASKPRALRAITYACPHCGGSVTVPQ